LAGLYATEPNLQVHQAVLFIFRGIDAVKLDGLAGHHDGVTIDDGSGSGEGAVEIIARQTRASVRRVVILGLLPHGPAVTRHGGTGSL
jgi:hypothetical protein